MANLKAKAYYKHRKVCFLTLNPIHLYSTTVQHTSMTCYSVFSQKYFQSTINLHFGIQSTKWWEKPFS